MVYLPLSTNYSFYAIPAMAAIAYYPAYLKNTTMLEKGLYNNLQPRSNLSKIQAKTEQTEKISRELAAKIARMDGAHYNTLENLPFFYASLLAANYARVEVEKLNIAAGLFVALRTLHTLVYIHHTRVSISYLRTVLFNLGLFVSAYLSIKAAGNIAAQ